MDDIQYWKTRALYAEAQKDLLFRLLGDANQTIAHLTDIGEVQEEEIQELENYLFLILVMLVRR